MNNVIYVALLIGVSVSGLLLMMAAMRKIPDDHRGVLFRLGRLVGELEPGLRWIVPLFDQVMLVDLREQSFRLPKNLTVRTDSNTYAVVGQFTCRVVAPIPAVMAAMQANRDVTEEVGSVLVSALQEHGSLPIDLPPGLQTRLLRTLNDRMSQQWQLKFTDLSLSIESADAAG